LLAILLMTVDLPTFGMPMIMALTALLFIPLLSIFSKISLVAAAASGSILEMIWWLRPLIATGYFPCALKWLIQRSVSPSSAISILFRTTTRGLCCVISFIIGLWLE